jgi:hyperosmotically inducible periplasmic protein
MEVHVNKPFKMLVGTSIALMLSLGFEAVHAQDDSASAAASTPAAKPSRRAKWSADHKLEAQVRHALTTHKVESSDIRVVARHGMVTLDGTVEDESMIPVATTAAQSVAGVKQVKNNLTKHEAGN